MKLALVFFFVTIFVFHFSANKFKTDYWAQAYSDSTSIGHSNLGNILCWGPSAPQPHQVFYSRAALAWPQGCRGCTRSCAHPSLRQQIGDPGRGVSRGSPDAKGKPDEKKMLWRKLPNTAPTQIFILITSRITFFLGCLGIASLEVWQNCHLLFPD